jgi:hypothetical protein
VHAAGLAVAVEKAFGVAVLLKEGHEAIFELTHDGKVIYTNHSKCGVLPKTDAILDLLGRLEGLERRRGKEPAAR